MRKRSSLKCISGCKVYTAYIRIKKQWTTVGQYHTLCGKFSRIEAEKEDFGKQSTATEAKPDDGLTEGIRYLKNLPSRPSTTSKVSDDELSTLCSSIG